MDTMQFSSDVHDLTLVPRNETLFTLANGYLGLRGDFEEEEGSYHKGTYINAFYDSEAITYGETAFGYAKNHETMLNLPDPKRIELEVDSLPFSLKRGVVNSSLRCLDFRTGMLRRTIDWTSEAGKRVTIETQRLVSFADKHCALISYTVTALEEPLSIKLTSYLDTDVRNRTSKEDPRVGSKFSSNPLILEETFVEENQLSFGAKTRNSKLSLWGSAFHVASRKEVQGIQENNSLSQSFSLSLAAGESFTLHKYIAFTTENDSASFLARKSAQKGFDAFAEEQRFFLDDFWKVARIVVEGDESTEQALQFNLFHLLQSCGRDGITSMAAKGLTGEGYEGHYFWDTEAYALPVFTYLKPDMAKSLLDYRYSILSKARERAQIMSLKGALFPWRTISGEECSAYYPAGSAQYHIDADILYAAEKYVNATQSEVPPSIVEMAIETSRMWVSLGCFIKGRFCINEVTGPDEYTACVNNNAFTNLMAQNNLRFTLRVVSLYQEEGKELPLQLEEEEIEQWKAAEQAMYIPFDADLGIYAQDDSFLSKADWPFVDTVKENYPLLLHYHPLVIYRHRVLKQPDLVLAQFLLSGLFSRAEKIRNFAFYEPYTTGDSSLSHCIQSIMASEAFQSLKAYSYFKKTVRLDIDDIQGNSVDGIHTASMAGSWMALVYGFAGFRDWQGVFSFNPQLPSAWKALTFCLRLGSSVIRVCLRKEEVVYTLVTGDTIVLVHRTTPFTLVEKESKSFSLAPQLEGVLFDLDGVIVDTAHFHYQAWKQVSDENNLHFDREVNKLLLGVSRDASLQAILDHNQVSLPAQKREEVLKRKNDAYVASLQTLSPKDVFPGILELLTDLKKHGVKTALASASRNARTVCSKLEILDLFDGIADVEHVQMSKPEADIFLAASEQIGAWYTNCIGVEDAKAGIEAIKRAGMTAVGIGTKESLPDADYVLSNTGDLTYDLLVQIMENALG